MAKKSKGFGELLKQQQTVKTPAKALEKLRQKVQKGPLADKFAGIVTNPKGQAKMSEVLEAFVEPYLEDAPNYSQRQKLLGIAVLAWNLSLIPEDKRQPMMDQFIKQGMKGHDLLAQQDLREILDEMMARKQKFFSGNKRFIIDFELEDKGDHFYLSVAATLMDQP